MLKQGLHKPLPVEKQVAIIYALTHGYLDDIAVNDIERFEEEMYAWFDENAKEILTSIRETGQLPEEADFNQAIENFKATFIPKENA